jgi:hypothetical protein
MLQFENGIPSHVKLMGLYGRWVAGETLQPAIIAKESAKEVFKLPFLRIF